MRKRSYLQLKAAYRDLRMSAFTVAAAQLADAGFGPGLRLTSIDAKALQAWREQWSRPTTPRPGGWNWELLAAEARRDHTGFTLAIWSGDSLCGLASGRTSPRNAAGGHAAVSLHDLEANPNPAHPLKGRVAFIAITAAESYGRLLGTRVLRVVDPLPGALRIYVQLGFTVVTQGGRAVYCEREISP